MNWTNQAESMAKAWAETQKNLWENWYNLAQAAPANSPFGTGLAGQWYDMASQGFEAWMNQADPTAKEVAGRLRAGQQAVMDFMAFSSKAWQHIGKKMENGEDWQAVMNGYVDQLRQQLSQKPEEFFAAAKSSGELWQIYQSQFQKYLEPWLQAGLQTPSFLGQTFNGHPAALGDLAGLYRDVYQNTFGQLIDSPTLGYTRELEAKMRQGYQTWLNLNEVSVQYQAILGEAWVKVFEGLQKELVDLGEKGQTVTTLGELSVLLTNVAEEAFVEVYRTEKYIRTQGKLVSTIMAYRLFQREVVELLCKLNDIPTRSEVDEAHRANYLLRKEMKALKKAMNGSTNGSSAELAEAKETIATLKQDVESLKQAVAALKTAPPKSSSTTRRKTAAPKTSAAKTTAPKTGEES